MQTQANVQSFFGKRSEFYEYYLMHTDQKRIASKYISIMLAKSFNKKKPRILCIGGGSGEGDLQIIKNLHRKFGDICIDYVDPSKTMYERFIENAKAQGLYSFLEDSYLGKFESRRCRPKRADIILALNSFYFINGWKRDTSTLKKLYGLLNENGVAVIVLRSGDSPHTEIKKLAGGGRTTAALLKASLKRAKMPYYSEKVGSRIYLDRCFDSKRKFINSVESYKLLSFILGDRWSRFGRKKKSEIIEGIRKRMKEERGRLYLDSIHEYIWIRRGNREKYVPEQGESRRLRLLEEKLRGRIRTYKDFPIGGIKFRDTTAVMRNKKLFRSVIRYAADLYRNEKIDYCVAKDMQGLIWAGAIANELKCGVVPMFRKDLAGEIITSEYEHEYNPNRVLNLQKGAIKEGQRVLLVDYILASGETMRNMTNMVEHLGGRIAGIFAMIELTYLNPRRGLEKYRIDTIVRY